MNKELITGYSKIAGVMGRNYGSRNSVGLGMFALGGLATLGAANNTRNNGVNARNSLIGAAGLGAMGYGGYKLGVQRLFTQGGRTQIAKRAHQVINTHRLNTYKNVKVGKMESGLEYPLASAMNFEQLGKYDESWKSAHRMVQKFQRFGRK